MSATLLRSKNGSDCQDDVWSGALSDFTPSEACDDDESMGTPQDDSPPATCEATQASTNRTFDRFVALIIYDGRFLETFTVDPEAVARELAVTVPPEVLDDLRGRDPSEVLAEVTERMTQEYALQRALTGVGPPVPSADFGVTIGVAIAGTVVIVGVVAIVEIVRGESSVHVIDQSADADLKM